MENLDQDSKKSSATIKSMWKKAFKSLKSTSDTKLVSPPGDLRVTLLQKTDMIFIYLSANVTVMLIPHLKEEENNGSLKPYLHVVIFHKGTSEIYYE